MWSEKPCEESKFDRHGEEYSCGDTPTRQVQVTRAVRKHLCAECIKGRRGEEGTMTVLGTPIAGI